MKDTQIMDVVNFHGTIHPCGQATANESEGFGFFHFSFFAQMATGPNWKTNSPWHRFRIHLAWQVNWIQ